MASLALMATTDILVAFLPLLGKDKGVPPVIVGFLLATRAAASLASRLLLPVLLAHWSLPALVIATLAGAATTLCLVALAFRVSVDCRNPAGDWRVLSGLGTANYDDARYPGRSARFQGSSNCPPLAWQPGRSSEPCPPPRDCWLLLSAPAERSGCPAPCSPPRADVGRVTKRDPA